MGRKIAIMGTGAVGGYAGAHMVQAGEDVTFIDPWPAHVEHMRKHGLRVTHARDVPEFTVPVRALHVTDAQQLAKEPPIDIAFVCMKSYDTAWATTLIRQYLAPDAYVVLAAELHERGDHRGHRRLGQDARLRRLQHHGQPAGARPHSSRRRQRRRARTPCSAPARRTAASSSAPTKICRLVAYADSAKVTNNLWGERWSKLVTNAMANGRLRPAPASAAARCWPAIRSGISRRALGSEAIRVGQALGYQLEDIYHLPPETIARAGEGDAAAMRACDEERFQGASAPRASSVPRWARTCRRAAAPRSSFSTGLIVREGERLGLPCRANAVLTDLVKRVERGELEADPRHITELRLN